MSTEYDRRQRYERAALAAQDPRNGIERCVGLTEDHALYVDLYAIRALPETEAKS